MRKIGRTIRRRRKHFLTDYKARLGLLKSGKLRLVVRKTNRYIIAQIVESEVAQDKIVAGVTSKDLLAFGWPKEFEGSLKSRMAAYLTGMLLAKKAKVNSAILDIGLQRNVHKGRIYAVMKGTIDAGIKIPCDEESLPKEEFITKNEKLSKIFDKVKGEIKK